MKPAGIAAALIAGMLLAACKTTEPGSGPVAAAPAAAPAAAAAVALADPLAPGTLHFILSPSGSGNYYGWQIQILTAERSQGFRPFLSRQMGEGDVLNLRRRLKHGDDEPDDGCRPDDRERDGDGEQERQGWIRRRHGRAVSGARGRTGRRA